MITGTLAKFETTDQGITVTVKCNREQMSGLNALYKSDVRVEKADDYAVQDSKTDLLKQTIDSIDALRADIAALCATEVSK